MKDDSFLLKLVTIQIYQYQVTHVEEEEKEKWKGKRIKREREGWRRRKKMVPQTQIRRIAGCWKKNRRAKWT